MARLGVALLTLFSSFRAEPFHIHEGIRDRVTSLSIPNVNELEFVSPFHASNGAHSKLELLDTVLVASVDGKFHAVNRTSGAIQWSMTPADNPDDAAQAPGALSPLVRINNGPPHPDGDEDDYDTYVIEPQTGDIYVLPSHGAPDEPLQKLGLSMEQLVEFSPFTLSEPDKKRRQFLGKKETALLTIDIRTGDIKSYVNSDKECKWDEFEQEHTSLESYRDEDLDGVTRKHSPTVSIARTGKRPQPPPTIAQCLQPHSRLLCQGSRREPQRPTPHVFRLRAEQRRPRHPGSMDPDPRRPLHAGRPDRLPLRIQHLPAVARA